MRGYGTVEQLSVYCLEGIFKDKFSIGEIQKSRQEDTFPIVVVGIVTEIDDEWRISGEEAIKVAKSRGVDGFIECSPRTGENVEETFEAITKLMLANSGIEITI